MQEDNQIKEAVGQIKEEIKWEDLGEVDRMETLLSLIATIFVSIRNLNTGTQGAIADLQEVLLTNSAITSTFSKILLDLDEGLTQEILQDMIGKEYQTIIEKYKEIEKASLEKSGEEESREEVSDQLELDLGD